MATQDDWLSMSETVFGLIINKVQPVTRYDASQFCPPYDIGFSVWKDKGNHTAIAKEIGTSALQAALQAADTVSDDSSVDWTALLSSKKSQYDAGTRMQKIGSRLQKGQDVDATTLMELNQSIKNLANPSHMGLTDLKDVDISDWNPFKETGWDAIDKTVGGISAHRPTVVGADTGLGKSMWTLLFAQKYLKRWPNEKMAIYSLEMSKKAWKSRAVNLFPELTEFFGTGRLLVSDSPATATDVQLETAAVGADIVIIDYINYLIKGEITPQSLEVVNRQMNELCRTLGIPNIILHQFGGQMRTSSPIPTLSHFYMGTSSSNTAGLVIGLGRVRSAEDCGERFVYDEDREMLMAFLKSGDGFLYEQGPGAVFLPRVKNLWSSDNWVWQTEGEQRVEKRRRRE